MFGKTRREQCYEAALRLIAEANDSYPGTHLAAVAQAALEGRVQQRLGDILPNQTGTGTSSTVAWRALADILSNRGRVGG